MCDMKQSTQAHILQPAVYRLQTIEHFQAQHVAFMASLAVVIVRDPRLLPGLLHNSWLLPVSCSWSAQWH